MFIYTMLVSWESEATPSATPDLKLHNWYCHNCALSSNIVLLVLILRIRKYVSAKDTFYYSLNQILTCLDRGLTLRPSPGFSMVILGLKVALHVSRSTSFNSSSGYMYSSSILLSEIYPCIRLVCLNCFPARRITICPK